MTRRVAESMAPQFRTANYDCYIAFWKSFLICIRKRLSETTWTDVSDSLCKFKVEKVDYDTISSAGSKKISNHSTFLKQVQVVPPRLFKSRRGDEQNISWTDDHGADVKEDHGNHDQALQRGER